MTPPINIDGTQITGASIDGQDVSAITVDGTQVFTPRPPASAVHHSTASDFDGSQFVADIGPNMPVDNGSPQLKSKTLRNNTVDVVECQSSTGDYFQTSSLALDGSYCIIMAVAPRDGPNAGGGTTHFSDAATRDEFTFFNNSGSGLRMFMNNGVDTNGGTLDTNLNVYAMEIVGTGTDEVRLFKNGTSNPVLTDTATAVPSLSGWSLNARGDGAQIANHDIAEWTVLEDHPQQDRDDEVARLKKEYNI